MKDQKYWAKLVGGLCVVFALFQWSASALGRDLGQADLLVGLLAVTATLVNDLSGGHQ